MIKRIVQTKTATGTAPTVTITWTNDTTTGDTIVVVVGASNTSSTVSSITDSQTNTYTKVDSSGNGVQGELWIANNITGGTTPTITITLASIFNVAAIAREYSGMATSALDANHAVTTFTSVAQVRATSSAISSQARELVVGWIACNTTVPTTTGGFTQLTTLSGTGVIVAIADKVIKGEEYSTSIFTVTTDTVVIGVANLKDVEEGSAVPIKSLRPYPFAPGLAR